jgi:hypothetical protein
MTGGSSSAPGDWGQSRQDSVPGMTCRYCYRFGTHRWSRSGGSRSCRLSVTTNPRSLLTNDLSATSKVDPRNAQRLLIENALSDAVRFFDIDASRPTSDSRSIATWALLVHRQHRPNNDVPAMASSPHAASRANTPDRHTFSQAPAEDRDIPQGLTLSNGPQAPGRRQVMQARRARGADKGRSNPLACVACGRARSPAPRRAHCAIGNGA